VTTDLPDSGVAVRPERANWFSLRVTLLALLLAPVTAYWAADQGVDVIFSLMVPPVVLTFIVAMANLVVRRIAPKMALTEGELVIFYGMHAVMCAICAEWTGVIQPYIHSYALYKANDSHFDTYINPYTNPWFFIQPKDADKYTDYRNGGFGPFYFLTKLHLWWPYIASWTLLISLVCLAMLCINSLMRDEWTNREKLAFPIIQLPMAIVQAGAGRTAVFKHKLFVVPFIVMFSIDIINGFHFMYPSIPYLNVRFLGDVAQFVPYPPWNAIGWTPIGIFPYMAAIGFFMPTDLLFSCVFFFFFRKFLQVFTYAIGYTESAGVFGGGGLVPGPPYFSEQSWGAFLGLFVTSMWVARNYLKEVWHEIRHGGKPGDRGVPHRVAFVLLLVSLAAIVQISFWIGIPLWMTALTVILFLVFSIAVTRMRAQIGAPSHEMAFMGPNQMLVDFVGTQGLSQAGISRLVTTFFFMNRIHRSHPMPHQLEAIKMGDTTRLNQRALFLAILLATVFGSVMGHFAFLSRGYHYAAPQAGGDTAGVVSQLMEQHHPPNIVAIAFVILGFAMVLALDFVRFRVPGFWLHPAGYALAMNFGLDYFWFGLIIVLIVKVFVERYYGLRGHEMLHRIALGIVLAEFLAEGIWTAVAIYNHQATYSISINGRLGWDQ
jgi:hypothetical protein